MAWRLPSPRSLASAASSLKRDRALLTATIATPVGDRRGEFRLLQPAYEGVFSRTGEVLLNLSPSGLALGVRRKATFARGERYSVTFREGQTQAEIEGQVCWTRSIWHRESPEAADREYFQTAGLAIANSMSEAELERWREVRRRVQDGTAQLEMEISPL